MHKKLILSLAFAFAVVGFAPAALAVTGTASSPESDGGVTPYIISGANQGGNRTCAEVGTAFFNDPDHYEFSSQRFDNGDQFSGSVGPITWSTTDEKFVSWNGNHDGLAVIVKGGDDANVYEYDDTYSSDSGLASPPVGKKNKTPKLSNITFCWNTESEEPEQPEEPEEPETPTVPETPGDVGGGLQELKAPAEAPQAQAPEAGVAAGGAISSVVAYLVALGGSVASMGYGLLRLRNFGA
jgi:hypothetical protein